MNPCHPRTRKTALALAAILALGIAPLQDSQAAACTFNQASGDWNVATNWSCIAVPGAADTAIVAASRTATMPYGVAGGATSLNNAGTVYLGDWSGLTLQGSNQNTGTLMLGSAGNTTSLNISGATAFNGNGSIGTTNRTTNRIVAANGTGDVLTLGSGQSITGAVQIGAGTALGVVNNGSITANLSAGITLNAQGGVTNNGLLRGDGAALTIQNSSVTQGAGGVLSAINGGAVQLQNTSINGGTLVTAGGGAVTTVYGSTARLAGVTNTGTLNVTDWSTLYLDGTLTNNGSLNLNSVGNVTTLVTSGNRLIDGSGSITLSDRSTNRIQAATAGDSLTLGASQTLSGAGQIGAGSGLVFNNAGTVVATQSNALLINAATVNNTGTLQLQTTINSAGGQIEARNGSRIELLSGAVINNAAFSATGTGSLITTASGAYVSMGGGTVNGPMTINDYSTLSLTADATYNGTLSMASVGNVPNLQIDGTRTLSGNATLALSDRTTNRIVAAHASGDVLTLGSGVVVQGGGSIGVGGTLGLVNNGLIAATASSGITLSTSGSVTNNSVMRGDGAALTITGTTVGQGSAGVLSAVNGGSVRLTGGSRINGGTLVTASGGAVTTFYGSTARLAGVTNTGTLNVADYSTLYLDGTLTNNGSLNLSSAGNITDLVTSGNRLIDGSGSITLTDRSTNRILAAAAGDSLTLGANQTLQGAGTIGAGGALNFTNNGTLIGNVSNALTINSSGTVTNNKTVRADGGTVTITGTAVGQGAAGLIEAINNGVVNLTGGSRISGGTLATAGGGQIGTVYGNTATIANLVNTGTFNVVDYSTLVLQGTVTNNGAINVSSGGNVTELAVSGQATLGGSGTTTLSDRSTNRILAQGAGSQLTNGAGHTIQGSGSFGNNGALDIVNQGTITANQSNALNIQVAAANTVRNQAGGLMQAVGGRTLNLSSAVQNNGTIGANGGFVNANAGFSGAGTAITTGSGVLTIGAASTVGTLTNNGSSAGALALGGNDITVSGDYTNANWGSGNSFNRRTNVSGAGQILAGGDVAQVISGTGVSNGGTSNATLTIGNMHVGTNTYNYTIGNSGTTGPTLRGAVQTSVNGANISDGRLGVADGNYDAGAPGGAGAAQTVTFTANSAGALGSMSGQAINLRSNFDNIADQKLNIVLGANAAAYNLAGGSANPAPATVANQRTGGTNTVALTVNNSAASGNYSEDLNASVASVSGAVSGSGSVSGLLAGNSGIGINVGVDTGSAGAKTGTVTLAYTSTGTVGGVSNGLGQTSVGSQAVTVSGNVYQAASGQLQGSPLNFGTVQVGQTVSQNLVVRNTATGTAGYVEDLNASFGATSGTGAALISGSGSLSGILAGSNSTAANGTMTVSVNTAAAGVVNGSIAVNYVSAGAVGGVSNGLGLLAVGSEPFGVNGTINATANVINAASPQFGSTSVNLGAVRVGAASPTAGIALSNQATAAPQAALNASIGSNGAPVTAGGSVSLLAPGAGSNALQVGLNTAVAGNYTGANAGSATVQLVSDASNVGGCAPNCQMTLAPQTISVSGKVYNPAVGQLDTPVLDFGIVRVGDTVSAKNIVVKNVAMTSALDDTLRADLTGLAGPLSAGGPVTGVAAQGSGQITVGLSTGSAAIVNQLGSIRFLSQNADMADAGAGADATVQVMAQVNNLANADFDLLSGIGTLSDDGHGHYVLDLGSFALGGSGGNWMLQLDNEVGGPADMLLGGFDLSGASAFALSGWDALSGLAAGQAQGGLSVGFVASALGLFEDEIVFNGWSSNGWGDDLAQVRSLTLRARVFDPGSHDVPEPGTLALLALGVLLAQRSRARRARPGRGAGDGAGA